MTGTAKEYTREFNKIINSCEFKELHDKFRDRKTAKNYAKLLEFLRKEDKNLRKIIRRSTTLLTDEIGGVIFNSKLKDYTDENSNSFDNYSQGRIMFENIYQCQASTIADKLGESKVNYEIPKSKHTYVVFYISKHVGSTYTAGTQASCAKGKNPCMCGRKDGSCKCKIC